MNRPILLPRRTHRQALLTLLAGDWALTKRRMAQRAQFIRNYLYLRSRGFTRNGAWRSAFYTFNDTGR